MGPEADIARRRRRQRLRRLQQQLVRRLQQQSVPRLYQPPPGYGRAKAQLQAQGRHFERARREFGFEDGVFVDGAFLGSDEVIALAKLSPGEVRQKLAKRRQAWKDLACNAVEGYMQTMGVSLDEFIRYVEEPVAS